MMKMEPASYLEPNLEGTVEKAVFGLSASVTYRKAFQREVGIGVEWAHL